tara:strand:- start:128 stop:382 length:255 start_codon:yes stop_codon:yes gene_type:complete
MDLPNYLEKLPLNRDPAVEELIIKVLMSCRDDGITQLSVGSLMLLLGVSEDNIDKDMYEDVIELTPRGIDIALAMNEKASHVVH